MPVVIFTIDEIALKKNRDALYLSFYDPRNPESVEALLETVGDGLMAWREYPPFKAISQWMDKKGIKHSPCYAMLDPGLMSTPYMGDLYVDVPFDLADPLYQELSAHLEDADGNPILPGVWFCGVTLETARRHAAEKPNENFDW